MRRLLIIVALLVIPVKAFAHPHVWVEASADITLDKDGNIKTIKEKWIFDEFFSESIISVYDEDGDGKINEAENKVIEEEGFANVGDYNFYTHIFDGKEELKIEKVSGFRANIVEENLIAYEFEVKPTKKINVLDKDVSIGLYDGEYYVEMTYDVKNIKTVSDGDYKISYFEDEGHPTYMGLVFPRSIRMSK